MVCSKKSTFFLLCGLQIVYLFLFSCSYHLTFSHLLLSFFLLFFQISLSCFLWNLPIRVAFYSKKHRTLSFLIHFLFGIHIPAPGLFMVINHFDQILQRLYAKVRPKCCYLSLSVRITRSTHLNISIDQKTQFYPFE